jgi:VWFA-related protein
VLVPVTVTDHSGQHISGLQQSDFTVLDDGKPQKISTFEEIKEVAPTMSKPKEAGMFTNAVDQPQTAHGMTILVLDAVNTDFMDQSTARMQLLKFLADHVSTTEPTALILLTSKGTKVIHDFTTNPAVLVDALKAVSSRSDTKTLSGDVTNAMAATGNIGPASTVQFEISELDAFYNGVDGGYGNFQLNIAISNTLKAMRQIAEGMQGIPGRKSLIWATGGFPFAFMNDGTLASLRVNTTGQTHQDIGGLAGGVGAGGALNAMPESSGTSNDDVFARLKPEWEKTMQALHKANIAIYPIDARGLVSYVTPTASRSRMSDVYGTEMQVHSSMNDIASITGGRAYYNTNDITGAFNKATRESSQYYLVGYYAEKVNPKTLWHKLQVKVEKPGLEVRTRTGYMATPATTGKPSDDLKKQEINTAMVSPLDFTALQMRVYVDPPQAGSGNKKKIPFEIVINPGAATLDTSNKNKVSLDLLAAARNPKGEDAGHAGYKLEANIPNDQVQTVAQQGLNYKGALELPPGQYTLRFVVRDNFNGKLGSVTAPVTVQ